MSLVRHVAEKMRVLSRSVEREIQIATAIPQAVRHQLIGTDIEYDKTGLLKLPRLSVDEQQRAVEQWSPVTLRVSVDPWCRWPPSTSCNDGDADFPEGPAT